MRRLLPFLLLGAAGLLTSSSALGAPATVRVRVAPTTVTAGNNVFIVSSVFPNRAECKATVLHGATPVWSATKKISIGVATWRYHVAKTAPGGKWSARVSCGKAGAATARFTVKALPPPPPATIPAKVVVVKSGASARHSDIGSEFVGYGVVLQNVSPDEDALDVSVTVNILDPSGKILKTDATTYAGIPAGATYYAGGEAIYDGSVPPARLEVTVQVGRRQKKAIGSLPVVSNVQASDGFIGARVHGEVANPYTKTLSQLARISFVCLDGAGNVVGGGYGYLDADVPPGGRIGFDESVEGSLSASQIASVQVSVEPDVKS